MEAIVVEDYRLNGDEFTEKVVNDLKRADYFIPIITLKSYQKSQWLNQEIGYAFAKLSKEKIYPIVQKNVIPKLKGFIHNQAEISCNFDSFPKDARKERLSFRKSIRFLLEDICKKENLDKKTGLNYNSLVKTDYSPSDSIVKYSLDENLKFNVNINLSTTKQSFRFYYLLMTDQKENIWIGFTDAELPLKGFIIKNENTQKIDLPKKLNYNLTDSVEATINRRIKMMQDSNFKLKGKPILIDLIRFRGDKISTDPIHYHFTFYKS